MIVTAVGQIGCIPYELARYNNRNNSTGRCNDKINNAIALFNSQLKKLVDRFNNGQLQGAKFVYLDTYKSTSDLAANGAAYGELYKISHTNQYVETKSTNSLIFLFQQDLRWWTKVVVGWGGTMVR